MTDTDTLLETVGEEEDIRAHPPEAGAAAGVGAGAGAGVEGAAGAEAGLGAGPDPGAGLTRDPAVGPGAAVVLLRRPNALDPAAGAGPSPAPDLNLVDPVLVPSPSLDLSPGERVLQSPSPGQSLVTNSRLEIVKRK